jgi:hypothetical protein
MEASALNHQLSSTWPGLLPLALLPCLIGAIALPGTALGFGKGTSPSGWGEAWGR